MADPFAELAKHIVSPKYVNVASQNYKRNEGSYETLLRSRCLHPTKGWTNDMISEFLYRVSLYDTNNFRDNIGVGEREGRVKNELVRSRHYSFAHGIGRSGDIQADQPKAIGSSMVLQITNRLVVNCVRLVGCKAARHCAVIPMCTGMTLGLSMRTLAFGRPKAKYVLWPRIDQKTCFKSIIVGSYIPVIIQEKLKGDMCSTNLESLEEELKRIPKDEIVCVMTTSSCFAPRVPDDIVGVAKLCRKYDVAHLINNAFGIQCFRTMNMMNLAMKSGRVDMFVSSTDKNFEVPIGGALVVSQSEETVKRCAQMYAGRGSFSPILDLFVTLIGQSQKSFIEDLKQREWLMDHYFVPKARELAEKWGERILETMTKNRISFCMSLDTFANPTEVGGKLFYRQVTGPRVYPRGGSKKKIMNVEFEDYGAHMDAYPASYLVMSCAIGIDKNTVDTFCARLDKIFRKCKRVEKKKTDDEKKEEE